MAAPTSGLIAEFFLQNLENIYVAHLSDKKKKSPTASTPATLISRTYQTTSILYTTDLKFTAETETENKLNYLDITIHRTPTGWKTSVYRKPTFTDTIIPYSSNHPAQNKYAAIRFLYNRLNTYNLHEDEYRTEENTIHSIMFNNAFPIYPSRSTPPKENHHSQQPDNHNYT